MFRKIWTKPFNLILFIAYYPIKLKRMEKRINLWYTLF